MAQINNLLPILEEAVLDADTHRLNFNNFKSKYNQHDINKVDIHGVSDVSEVGSVEYYTNLINSVKPVGSIIQVWDNSEATVIGTVAGENWTIMDGSTISDVDSLFNGVTLPDMSGAYLCVTRSEALSTTIFGENTRDYEHLHTLEHSHTFAHEHDFSHAHTTYALVRFLYGMSSGGGRFYYGAASGGTGWPSSERITDWGNKGFESYPSFYPGIGYCYATTETGVTESLTTPEISSDIIESTDTFSASTDVRPMSIKVRYYLRYK